MPKIITIEDLTQAAHDYGVGDLSEARHLASMAYDAGLATAVIAMFDHLRAMVTHRKGTVDGPV